MAKLFDRSGIIFLGKVILIALLIVFIIRLFLFDLFTVSTDQMEASLTEGDEIVVSKVHYGFRLPITPLAVPFISDKYYSHWIKLPYKRLFSSPLRINDVVVFNNPIEQEKPLDKRSLLVSRCVALPGDTISITDGIYLLNNKEYVYAPTKVDEYFAFDSVMDKLEAAAKDLDISFHKNMNRATDTAYFSLSRYEAYLLRQNVSKENFCKVNDTTLQSIAFIVPSRGVEVLLTPGNIRTYCDIMKMEQGNRISLEEGRVKIDGKETDVYTFQDDYYWMLSDNTLEGIDSRMLGFIPFSHIIGRATHILYSNDEEGFRLDRFLKSIN